ncbi:MAG: ADP-forming succinate--CoA ligase subunit beta [Bacteroidales bacterium]|jgi:succinyl-CoA synthetase beta subunit|nr:ADP-forming succinate--CoA ligase subunit beta [Bacteroidales bacterium]
MKLHEYQSKALLARKNLPVPKGVRIDSEDEDLPARKILNTTRGVVKAQAYTGGRGKAGGVKLFKTKEEAIAYTKGMVGINLVTHQTGPEGVKVHHILIEEHTEIIKEYYVAILIDRAAASPVLMISPDGGMDIEAVAEQKHERILKNILPIDQKLGKDITDKAAAFLGLDTTLYEEFAFIANGVYEVFNENDAMLIEINPLVLKGDHHLSIIDCKFDIDDNAYYRQTETGGDPNAEKTEAEIEAAKWGMTYIALDGKIGCMVNGAGLAMATMDSIKHYGSEPANFLDVGGSADEEAVAKAFEIISSDKNVECILINIFGGIMKCDTIANGIIAAVKSVGLNFPLVVRLEGTNAELGKKLINESGLNIISAESLADGAEKSVALLKS